MRTSTLSTQAPPEDEEYEDALPRWIPWAATLVCLAGLFVAVYLTFAHYMASSVSLACPATSSINCEKVTTSPQSIVFGVPLPIYGLVYFVVMTGLNLPRTWSSTNSWVAPLRLGLAVAGIGFALYLVATELLVIGAICLWCTAEHVMSFVLLMLVVTGTSRTGLRLLRS